MNYIKNLKNFIKFSVEIPDDYYGYLITHVYNIRQKYRIRTFNSNIADNIQIVWKEHTKSYRHLCSLLTNHPNRNMHILPKLYSFIDYDGTRYNHYDGYKRSSVPHVHSICLVNPQTERKFEALVDSEFAKIVNHPCLPCLQRIHTEKIGDTEHDMQTATGYAAKFFTSAHANLDRELSGEQWFEVYPTPRH